MILDHLGLCSNTPADAPLPILGDDLKTIFEQLCVVFDIFPKQPPSSHLMSHKNKGVISEKDGADNDVDAICDEIESGL